MPFAKCIVATGGGAVIRRQNWGYMQHGVVIWLDGTPELLASHVVGQSGGIKSRPLIFSNNQPVAEEVSGRFPHGQCPGCFNLGNRLLATKSSQLGLAT